MIAKEWEGGCEDCFFNRNGLYRNSAISVMTLLSKQEDSRLLRNIIIPSEMKKEPNFCLTVIHISVPGVQKVIALVELK